MGKAPKKNPSALLAEGKMDTGEGEDLSCLLQGGTKWLSVNNMRQALSKAPYIMYFTISRNGRQIS
jgi:hypothetical protein